MKPYRTTAKKLNTFGTTEFGMPFFEAVLKPNYTPNRPLQRAYQTAVNRNQAVHRILDVSVASTDSLHRFYSNKEGLRDSDLDQLELYALFGPRSGNTGNPSNKTYLAHHSLWTHEDGKKSKAVSTLRSEEGILNLSTRVALYLGAEEQPLNVDELATGLVEIGEYIPQKSGYMGSPDGPKAKVSEMVCDFTADLWFHLVEWNWDGNPKEDDKRRELHGVKEGQYLDQFANITKLTQRLMEPKDRFRLVND